MVFRATFDDLRINFRILESNGKLYNIINLSKSIIHKSKNRRY